MNDSLLLSILTSIRFNYSHSESENKSKLSAKMLEHYPFVYCPQDKFRGGIPDILYENENGLFCAIELKMDGRCKSSSIARQENNLKKIAVKGLGYLLVIKKDNNFDLTQFSP